VPEQPLLSLLEPQGMPHPVWSIEAGTLTMDAPPRSDLFVNPSGSDGDLPSLGRLVTSVDGDFMFSARVEADIHQFGDAGVLYVEYDEQLWFKLCLECTPKGEPSVVSVVTRGTSDDANSWILDRPYAYFRVSRRGPGFALHASTDGGDWTLVRHFGLGIPDTAHVKVGFLAQSPVGEGCRATFTEVSLVHATLADIRDGS
jgi:regulation of enolase protein 1 (concanavalin A-like superfamily)